MLSLAKAFDDVPHLRSEILDQRCYKVPYFFTKKVTSRWNALKQSAVDASSINVLLRIP